jgi:TetR/AcrR family tetracycline transcriptional repressor
MFRMVNMSHETVPLDEAPTGQSADHADGWGSRSLWFAPSMADAASMADENRRPTLTRQRVVAEALTIIAEQGVQDLTMRNLAARLGVVPGALYRHVRNKEQLQDLALDGVLAEVDCDVDHALAWTARISTLAHRLRTVLEDHPGVAGILKLRDPLGPHSLTLAEALLQPLQAAGFPAREAGLAFFLIVDYTVGFAVSSTRTSVNEQRVRDVATREQLHEFFRSLPADRFPTLIALGEHVWLDNRDERFTAGLDVLVHGLEHARRAGPADTRGDRRREAAEHPGRPMTPEEASR